MRTGDEIRTEALLAAMDAADAEAVILPASAVPDEERPLLPPFLTSRSEERRVGKECRSRWYLQKRYKKRASADTQTGHRQRLLVRFPGIQTSAEIDTYFRAKEETAQGIQSLRLVNLRRSEACNHRLFRPLTVYISMPCGRSADRR